MGNKLPRLDKKSFRKNLEDLRASTSSKIQDEALDEVLIERLWIHYCEMCRWNQRLSLIGPGTGEDIVRRHYWESLEGVAFLEPEDDRLVDIGSGGGFPGWVIAAARPDLEACLIEPREKKWAFLQTAIRKAGLLSCRAVNARVEIPLPHSLELPEAIDVVTSRALAMSAETLEAIVAHSPHVRFLFWVGKEEIDLPKGYRVTRSRSLPGSFHRRIVEVARASMLGKLRR